MKTAALITAAGMGSGKNRFTPILELGGETMIERSIRTIKEAGIELIVLITGAQQNSLKKIIDDEELIFLDNPDFHETDMFRSVCIGLKYLQNRCDRVLFNPADVPLLSTETLTLLLSTKTELTIPVYNRNQGHPVLISSGLIPKLLKFKGDGGLREALKQTASEIQAVEVTDKTVLLDINSSAEYRELIAIEKSRNNQNAVRPIIGFELDRQTRFFSERTARFLLFIDRSGSIQTAAQIMNISYSKGWKMINEAEQELGFKLLNRAAGGAEGGQSEMTDRGRKLVNAFLEMNKELNETARDLFPKHFGDLF